MDVTEDFGDADLDNVRLSTLQKLSESKENNNISNKKKLIRNNNIDNQNNDSSEENSSENLSKKIKKPKNFYDSYISCFTVFLIQSLISLGFYYIFYLVEFDTNIIILRICPLILMLIIIIIAWFLSNSYFYSKHEKLSSYSLFFLINISKIAFDFFLYLYMVSDKENDGLGYSYFEARAYWKISMSFFYVIFMIYIYISKKETYFDICAYITFASVCIILCIFLIVFTQKEKDNMFRVINYSGFAFLELIFLMFFIYPENSYFKFLRFMEVAIDWKVNRIDFFRFGFFIFPLIIKAVKSCTNKCGCFRRRS